jgi:hypothetical protein
VRNSSRRKPRRKLKGSDVKEVDDFLNRISAKVDSMNALIDELQRRLYASAPERQGE